ncbi:MAG: M20/M25/M40 family metallo-hydrolase [Terriglobales bacterium]
MTAHMNNYRKLTFLTIASLVFVPFMAGAQAKSDAEVLIQEALKPSPMEHNLRHLTDEIGGRVPGTPAMDRAVAWGVAAFKDAGADRVHTETFRLPNSWAEGATVVDVSSIGTATDPKLSTIPPVEFKARAVSIALAPALSAKHVPVIDVGRGTAADFKKAGDISGKLILVHSDVLKTWADLFNEYMDAPPVIDAAVKGKAKAIAFIATREHDILYRHTNAMAGEIDRIPMVVVAREDGERMGRLVTSGHPVWADLSIPNKIGGPVTASNVVAEIRGSEKPEEFVILGAHLDSWELGTGALDNGCNDALVVDALRTIKASGLKPRRTIRFILFSGEEQGMVGSRAYAVAHRNELDKAVGVAVIDAGVGRVTGFSLGGRKDVVDSLAPVVAPLKQFGRAELKTDDVEWGTDHYDFLLEGVPTLVAEQEEGNYLTNYHATSDTYDKVDIPQLKKHVAEMTVVAFGIANAKDRLGARLTHAQIDKILRDTHSDEQMKPLGIWAEWQSGKRGRAK